MLRLVSLREPKERHDNEKIHGQGLGNEESLTSVFVYRKEKTMKRKGIKTILTLCMVFTMLFGNVLTVSAEETERTTFEQNLDKYFKLTDSYNFVGASNSTTNPYVVSRGAFSDNVYIGAFERYDTENPYIEVWIITDNEGILYNSMSSNVKEEYVDDTLEQEISLDYEMTATFVADGKTYYYTLINGIYYGDYTSTLSVYMLTPDIPFLSNASRIVSTFSAGIDLDWCGGEILEGKSDAEMTFDGNIPTPELVFYDDGRLRFGFNNATDDYYFEIKGRWWSVDDITLFKKNLMWKYSYESLIKNDLSTWVNNVSHTSTSGQHDLAVYGESSFNDLLNTYPVDNRTYSGGTNAIGNFLSGYNDGLDTLKMLLSTSSSVYNSCEFYVRYYTVDEEGNYSYGKWCHWLGNLANAEESSGSLIDDDNVYKGQQSESGLTDEELEILENSGNSRNDVDLKEETFGEYDSPITGTTSSDIAGYFQTAIDVISDIGNMLGEFPALVARVFSFLPDWVIACMGIGIVLVIILRIVGR